MTIDEETLKRWTNLEVHEVNKATVTKGQRLRELLSEDEPSLPKRDGESHDFDPEVLEELNDELSPLVRVNLRLPITIYFDHTTEAGAYVAHEWAIEAVQQLGATDADERDGKLWLSRATAMKVARDWPTVFQILLA